MEKFQRGLATAPKSLGNTTDNLNMNTSLSSQATEIPYIKVPVYGAGYSSILAEIQQASVRKASILMQHGAGASSSEDRYTSGSLPSKISVDNDNKTDKVNTSSLADSTSNSRISRRRKKNVEKFLKRQQLEKISEQTEEIKTPNVPIPSASAIGICGDTCKDKNALQDDNSHEIDNAHPIETLSVSTNDTISTAGSVNEIITKSRLPSQLRKSNNIPPTKNSSPGSEKSQVSLLTMLLKHHAAEKRSESCPPPALGVSPPVRPGAPHPPPDSTCSSPPMGTRSSAETIDSKSTLMMTMTVDEIDRVRNPLPNSNSNKNSTSTLPSNQRRRNVNPSDFTAPLFLW